MEKFLIKKVHKTIGEFELNVENVVIIKNAINVIFGENGAGKSTFLNYIIEDKNIMEGKKKALLTQTSYTFNRSCLKNIEMVLKWNKTERTALELLKIVELEEKKNCIGKSLSGGEKKRLAFAMALATDADIILLDEPFANVDTKNQKKLIEIIESLKGDKTIIIVSHRINICKEHGTYFLELEEGKLVKNGFYDEFFQ